MIKGFWVYPRLKAYLKKCFVELPHIFNEKTYYLLAKRYNKWNNARLISFRFFREYLFRFYPVKIPKDNLQVIYFTGMPRTGTSLMKNFLGAHPAMEVQAFQPKGFWVSAQKAKHSEKILIDKSTHYIFSFPLLDRGIRGRFAIVCIVRDPRDQLLSLMQIDRHPEISLSEQYWRLWHKRYTDFFRFVDRHKRPAFFLRYEDLVNYPGQAKTAFTDWLGLGRGENAMQGAYLIANVHDKQDPKAAAQSTINTKQLHKYTKAQDPKILQLIHAYKDYPKACSLMEQLGYLNKPFVPKEWRHIENLKIFIPNHGAK